MKNRVLFLCLLLVIGFIVYTKFFTCYRLSCVGVNLHGWRLKEVYEDKPGHVFRGLYESGDRGLMRVEIRHTIDPEIAVDYIQGRIAGMKALYDNVRAPYPGLISGEIQCDDEMKPTYETKQTSGGVWVAQIVGNLNDRLTFGTCTKDQIAYKGIKILFSCAKNKQLYDMEFFWPINEFSHETASAIVDSIGCK